MPKCYDETGRTTSEMGEMQYEEEKCSSFPGFSLYNPLRD